jgi:hypothetical protein
VALGTDYNILMIARLREEAREGKSSRDAAAQAVKHAAWWPGHGDEKAPVEQSEVPEESHEDAGHR